MRSLPPTYGTTSTQTTIHSYIQSYINVFLKIPNSERFCKNSVNKGIQSIYFHINTKCVFIWYMMNLNYKSIYFIIIREGV